MIVVAVGMKQVQKMRDANGVETRILLIQHPNGSVVQVPFDPIEAALIARDLSPTAGDAAAAAEAAVADFQAAQQPPHLQVVERRTRTDDGVDAASQDDGALD